ncbi:hypothetical protein AUJ44_04180 [Candidatus Nomurabacteria bacterium CG1_02_47_685]|nr:MAG: hypothetical protein AUJ44_04180 [Candidatus Nomurabacteria bacterium CG1_02_47_685]
MKQSAKSARVVILILLVAFNGVIWYAVAHAEIHRELKVTFLDIGQGDAIFIEAPNGNQLLIDGSPNKAVVRELAKVMPFYDRSIDVLMASHPDQDHIGGLTDVSDRFTIGLFTYSGAESDTGAYTDLIESIDAHHVGKVVIGRGSRIILAPDVSIDILFPDRDVSGMESNSTSIVAKLVYGDTAFLFTGDLPSSIENYLTWLDPKDIDVDVLKLGHHGSKTSSSEAFLGATSPRYAIISAGKDNSYGHPHEEVLDRLAKYNISALGTYEEGTIVFESDGEQLLRKK